jgi:hypothetical protein
MMFAQSCIGPLMCATYLAAVGQRWRPSDVDLAMFAAGATIVGGLAGLFSGLAPRMLGYATLCDEGVRLPSSGLLVPWSGLIAIKVRRTKYDLAVADVLVRESSRKRLCMYAMAPRTWPQLDAMLGKAATAAWVATGVARIGPVRIEIGLLIPVAIRLGVTISVAAIAAFACRQWTWWTWLTGSAGITCVLALVHLSCPEFLLKNGRWRSTRGADLDERLTPWARAIHAAAAGIPSTTENTNRRRNVGCG